MLKTAFMISTAALLMLAMPSTAQYSQAPESSQTEPTDAQAIVNQLIGAWELVEWSEMKPDGTKDYPLGEDALGQLVYSADGHVAAQLVRAKRTKFGSDDWRNASRDEGGRAFKEYFGYFGTYSIDLGRKAVVHHVEGAWFPNVEDSDQARMFKFENGQLVLDADTEWGKVRIVWRRPMAWNPTAT